MRTYLDFCLAKYFQRRLKMKYIRTKDGRISYLSGEPNEEITDYEIITSKGTLTYRRKDEVIKIADTIEELCDELVIIQKDFRDLLNADTHCLQTLKRYYEINKIEVLGIYGAIWTNRGLIYVAKMNDKGVLELL